MKKLDWVRAAFFVLFLCLTGCKKDPSAGAPAASAEPPSATAPGAPSGEAPAPELPRGPAIPIAVGPALEILPGEGLGPIRIGATVATIERLMSTPCEEKDEKACRYLTRAVEFLLDEKGITREMVVYRGDRPVASGPRVYGVFRGRSRQGLAPMMLQPAVRELYGTPLKTEQVKVAGPANTLEIHTYNGMNIEFDRIPNGTVVVGAIHIVKG
jgi:hypothetical protein